MAVGMVTMAVEFLERLRGGAGWFRDQINGRNDGWGWPLPLLWDEIQLGLARHGLQILERADRLRIQRFSDAHQCGEGASPREPAWQPRLSLDH